jgi:hypothetical protein
MSRGDLQEMEVGTKQSKTAVNANAKAGMPSQNFSGSITPGQTGGWEDLGGPTPENYKSTDDSSKLKTPGATLKQVSDVVTNRKGKTGAMGVQPSSKGMVGEDEEIEYDEDEELLEASKASNDDDDEEDEGGKGKGKKKEEDDDDEEDDDEEDDEEEDDEEDENGKGKKMKKEEFDIEEDVNALLAGEELSEEFQAKAKTIFEAALRSKVSDIKEALEEQYAVALSEEVEEIKSELSERVDSYLEYVSDEWFSENALVIENGLKSELTESFLQNLKGLFEEHYVSIPEDKYDVLESMVEKLDEMEEKLNEQIEKNISLNKRLAESVADGILDQVSEGLADTQKDKLASLSESVEFDSEEEYREKLETLKEAYFPSRNGSPRAKTETLSEGVGTPESVSGSMATYLKTAGSLFSK